jgi:hypothetical protein
MGDSFGAPECHSASRRAASTETRNCGQCSSGNPSPTTCDAMSSSASRPCRCVLSRSSCSTRSQIRPYGLRGPRLSAWSAPRCGLSRKATRHQLNRICQRRCPSGHHEMADQGTAHGRLQRAINGRNVLAAEMAARERADSHSPTPSLSANCLNVDLARYERALRWLHRLRR